MRSALSVLAAVLSLGVATEGKAAPFVFSTGSPDGLIGTASGSGTETADDFLLTGATTLTGGSFYGLIPTGSAIGNVGVEIYRVFPKDSDVGRTSGSPLFSTLQVPTRVNAPSDVAYATPAIAFTATLISPDFTANNSVLFGIHPLPNVFTGGDGPIRGQEVQISVTFDPGLVLPADHYFFVPQVELDNGDFFWLSAPKPIDASGTPFDPDLQSWIRNDALKPDWLRIGTDIVHAGPYNAAFSLAGETQNSTAVPEPGSAAIFAGALLGLGVLRRRRIRRP